MIETVFLLSLVLLFSDFLPPDGLAVYVLPSPAPLARPAP
jgi:hypothetical protein